MEICPHGRRKPCAKVTKVSTKMLPKSSPEKPGGSETLKQDATTPRHADAHCASQKKMNDSFCGIFGTDMEFMS